MRADVIAQIGAIIDGKCRVCEIRKQMEATYGKRGHYSQMDKHCLNNCDDGKKLQELGKHLGRGAKPPITAGRQRRREWMLDDDVY